jgi:hypothetical protein
MEDELLIHVVNERFDVVPSRWVHETKETTAVNVGIEGAATFEFGED